MGLLLLAAKFTEKTQILVAAKSIKLELQLKSFNQTKIKEKL